MAPAFWNKSGESADTNAKSRVCLRSKASEKARSLAKSDGARFMQATLYFQGGQAAQNNTCDGQLSSSDLPHSPCRQSGTLRQPLAARTNQGRHPSKAPRPHGTGSHRCGKKQLCSTHLVMSFGIGADVTGSTAEELSKHHTRRSSVRLLSGH